MTEAVSKPTYRAAIIGAGRMGGLRAPVTPARCKM